MKKKWKESEFYKKMKQVRVNRAVYLSAVVILLALAVVLAITAATNRARKKGADLQDDPTTQAPVTEPTDKPQPTGGDDVIDPVLEDVIPQLISPVIGKLSQSHSADVQVFSETMRDFRVHLGIDIATAADAQVFAAADGTVAKVWEDPMMGWCVALRHSGDCTTVYKNLAADLAEGLAEGSAVVQGQLLGTVGDSALLEIAEEPHLHMEMTVKGLQVDPLDYFSAAVVASLSEDVSYEDEMTGK